MTRTLKQISHRKPHGWPSLGYFFTTFTLAILLSCTISRADEWDTIPPDPDGSTALAEQFSALAHQTLRAAKAPGSAWRQVAPLFAAAARLNPKEPRFARSLSQVLLNIDDTAGAIDALKAYTELRPDDQTAQIQLIDLYLSTHFQSADAKLDYLAKILQRQPIPPEVRSAAAVRAARLRIDRDQPDLALKLLGTALNLNPLNTDALRMKFSLTQSTALALDRVNQLLSMLRANPADAAAASLLGQELASQGLVNQSLIWYSFANTLYGRTGIRPDSQFALGAGSELVIANRLDDAANLLSQYLIAVPDDPAGWFIRLSIARAVSALNRDDASAAAESSAQRQAQISLTNRLAMIRAAVGDSSATTRPMNSDSDSLVPDLSSDPARLEKSGRLDLADAYVSAVASLVWFDLYYRHDAVAADPLLAVLGKLLPDNDVQFTRLRGWRQYVGGDSAAAAATLSPIAKTDPLSQLAVVLINLANKSTTHESSIAAASKLLSDNPSGLLGAVFWIEFSKLDVKLDPTSQSEAVATVLASVPRDFFQIIDQPQSFYILRAEPLKSSYQYGEPMLIRLTIENISNYNLAVSDEGTLHPDMWFDAHLRGSQDVGITGAAIERIDQHRVLLAGQSVSAVVRVDQDALLPLLNQNPQAEISINFAIVSNPQELLQADPKQSAQASPGPCGYRSQLDHMISRVATPVASKDDRDKLFALLDQPDGGQLIRTLSVMANYIPLLKNNNSPDAPTLIDDLTARIRKAATTAAGPAGAWAKCLAAQTSKPESRASALSDMLHDSNWETRLLGLAFTPPDKQAAAATPLNSDPDPTVRDYARALSGYTPPPVPKSRVPATMPTTQPATSPSH